MRTDLYTGNSKNNNIMAPQILLFTQFAMFLAMIGTADSLFTATLPTIIFFTAFVIFARCSIYISENRKWLVKKNQ